MHGTGANHGANHGDVNTATRSAGPCSASNSVFDGNDVIITPLTPFTSESSDASLVVWIAPSVCEDASFIHGYQDSFFSSAGLPTHTLDLLP